MKAKFLELHLLQNFPPSCINRDGNNSPKTCQFGGVQRARISSQSLKRAIRTHEEFETRVGRADRTKLNLSRAMEGLKSAGFAENELESEATAMVSQLSKPDKATEKEAPERRKTAVLLYFGVDEWAAMAQAKRAGEAKWWLSAKPKSADILLFGRMLADSPELNVDAACQVAHAISTNRVANEFDYWSAVDDLQPQGEQGAAMLGSAEFNSACFYRYSCINLTDLANAFGDDAMARNAAAAFLSASYYAIPTGKQNTFAHFTLPDFAMVVVREQGAPQNLVNAFEKPIRPTSDAGLTEQSVEALSQHYGRRSSMLDEDTVWARHCHALSSEYKGLGDREKSVDALISAAIGIL
jgi:CRISPR system Cascade subunit CasC